MSRDLAIIGGGPSGMAAAIYTAREAIETVVYERDVVLGGLAAITAMIENYPGFPDGITGMQLADNLEQQARRFGAQFVTGITIEGLAASGKTVEVATNQGIKKVGAVLITTGNHYRRLEVPGEQEFTGRGVHYCATCDGPLYRDRELLVVGGGSSAMQESLFLAKFARKITLLVRGPQLKGSQALIDRVRALPQIELHYQTSVTAIEGDNNHVTTVQVEENGQPKAYPADGVFVFIGLLPNTDWLKGTLELDQRGFIKTDANYATSLPGVFAAGDVRSGSTYQIASAIAEGVEAALQIREYLDS